MITGIKSIDHRAATRTLYELDGTTPRGERIGVEFTACTNDGSKHSLPNIWHKAGYTPAPLPSYWAVDVYATDAAGCWGLYNPPRSATPPSREWFLTLTGCYPPPLPTVTKSWPRLSAGQIRRTKP